MQSAVNVPAIAHVIQQAVAPVFLLIGVGAILGVLTSRLARVVDRFRKLRAPEGDETPAHQAEMATLSRRARWIHWAITLCTICALFICIVIAALFVGAELGRDSSGAISVLFVAAMLALIAGLLCFLREIALATGNIEVNER